MVVKSKKPERIPFTTQALVPCGPVTQTVGKRSHRLCVARLKFLNYVGAGRLRRDKRRTREESSEMETNGQFHLARSWVRLIAIALPPVFC